MDKRNTIILISISSLVIFLAIGIFIANNEITKVKQSSLLAQIGSARENKAPAPENKKTTLFFVGDMMLTRGVEASVKKNFEGDFNRLFENIPEIKGADILFGNLEGDVSDKGNNVGSKYSFRMNPEVLPAIKNAGFDIVSFANNHVGDWNVAAFKDTLARLKENGILKIGAGINEEDTISPTVIEKNGTKFGFLGFTDVGPNWLQAKKDTAGILLASNPNLGEIIKNAKTKCDVLIVSFHWGEEYKLIHNSRQEKLAHSAIDNGADLIIGHHPHVMEDIEEYKNKTIVYSLGNFIFDQYFSKDTMEGMLFSATFEGKDLVKINDKVITLSKQFQPEGIFDKKDTKEKEPEKVAFNCPSPSKGFDDMTLSNTGQIIGLLDYDYIPKNLTEIGLEIGTVKNICLTKETKESFQTMSENAKKDGVVIKVSSGFRSYNTQKILYSNSLKVNGGNTSVSVAKPGYSEHQLGTTVDITGSSINYSSASSSFNGTLEDLWLKKNAYIYGFIQSYPKEKENITGYMYEPWHYRYVGIEKAKLINDSGLTIAEFLK